MVILRVMPHPISFLILRALYQGFRMRYHLFLNSMCNLVKINQTSFLLCVPCQYFLAPVYNMNEPKIKATPLACTHFSSWNHYKVCMYLDQYFGTLILLAQYGKHYQKMYLTFYFLSSPDVSFGCGGSGFIYRVIFKYQNS